MLVKVSFEYLLISFSSVPPDGTQDAAAQFSPGARRRLHKQAVHGPAEDDGGGEGARGAGLPQAKETETAAARPSGKSRKTQELVRDFLRQKKTKHTSSLNVWHV